MKCSTIKELLYDFLTKRLDKNTAHEVEAHIETCMRCQSVQEDIKKTILFLEQWKVPEVSPDFENRVMKKIKERHPVFLFRLKTITGYPVRAFAMVAILLILIASIYIVVPRPKNGLPKNVRIDLELKGVKHPIILKTKTEDMKISLKKFKNILKIHNGEILLLESLEKRIIVTLNIDKARERAFFHNLSQLGDLQIKKEDYRDKKGNPVIILQKKNVIL